MHRSRRLALAGALVAAVSLPLAFVDLPGVGSVGGVDAKAWPEVAALAVVAFGAILPDRAEPPRRGVAAAGAATAAVALALTAAKVVDAWRAASEAGGTVGPGTWVLAGGALLAAAGVAASFTRRV